MSDAADTTFSVGETKLLISIMKNLEGDLQSDWDAVAGEMNYKDGTIARARWNQTRRKKILGTGASTTKATKKPAATKKGTAAKAKTQTKKKIDSDDEDEEDQDEIKVAVKKEEDNDAEAEEASEEEEIEVKKPVAAKKKVAAKTGRAAAKPKVAAKPKATTNKRRPATFTTSSEDEDDEKNIKRLKRAVAPKATIETATDSADAADSSVVVETTEGATVLTYGRGKANDTIDKDHEMYTYPPDDYVSRCTSTEPDSSSSPKSHLLHHARQINW
ncbi:hypothetical protein D6D11_05374 [Aureobasidium pullulans]|nr:hypothetical protein D6D11_05374 [Aureobasidium pullulans]